MTNILRFVRTPLAATTLAALLGAGPVLAADAVLEEPPAPSAPIEELPVASWAGPYAGLTAGYGFEGKVEDDFGNEISSDGFIGGAFAGYQAQNGQFVYGLEGDVTYKGFSDEDFGVETSTGVEGSLRVRLGYAVTPSVLLYGTAGGAAQNLEIEDAAGSDDNTMVGWTAGAGADVKVTENIFARAEYRYSDYGSKEFDTGSGAVDVDSSDHRVMFGVGYKF
jgi:outer membrane immunogenic protein